MTIPSAARRALRRHVDRAVARLDPARYHQEPAYVAALLAKLDDVVYDGKTLKIEIKSTVVDDRGPGSAESIWGADFAMVAAISAINEAVEKAVLGQAKRGVLTMLPTGETERFRSQVLRMNALTLSTVGLEVPAAAGQTPMIRVVEVSTVYGTTWAAQSFESAHRHYEKPIFGDGGQGPAILVSEPIPLAEYLYAELIRCLHGDSRAEVVARVAQSSLRMLRVEVQQVV